MIDPGVKLAQLIVQADMKIKQGPLFAGWLVATLAFTSIVFASSYTSWLASGNSPTVSTAVAKLDQTAATSETAAGPEIAAASEEAAPSEAADASPNDSQLAGALADLKAAGIPATAAELKALTAKVGLGNAVRVVVFAYASGKSPDAILAMFESGKAWGKIAKELNLTIGPGIGGIVIRDHGSHPSPSRTPPGHHASAKP